MLHITNGDSAAMPIDQSGIGGDVLPWQDVLHEGPAPVGLSAADLREVRAGFVAACGWSACAQALDGFVQRDVTLDRALAGDEEIVLWFEHDLYDQLQLIQVLDRIAAAGAQAHCSLICVGAYPGIEPIYGLGQLDAGQMAGLFPQRQPVTTTQLDLATHAWQAFISADPSGIESLITGDTRALPFLGAALRRHLQQFPAVGSGLNRTERQVLITLAAGNATPVELFRADQQREERPFLGDATFWLYLSDLSDCRVSLLLQDDHRPFTAPSSGSNSARLQDRQLMLTDAGRAVLDGEQDCIRLNGIDRWLGGVHLHGAEAEWRWDEAAGRLR